MLLTPPRGERPGVPRRVHRGLRGGAAALRARPGETPDIEEERRLFHVGLTRAQRKLVLTHARTRFLYGQRKENPLSRFVKDIEDALKEMQEMEWKQMAKKSENTQLSLF